MASPIVLMRDGQVLAAGPTEAILTDEKLSATYGVPVHVYDADHRRVILLESFTHGTAG